MSSHDTVNPTGGVNMGRVMELCAPGVNLAVRLVVKEPWVDDFIRLRPDSLREPPLADPHEGWCGEGELEAPPYPIGSKLNENINHSLVNHIG
jgi:hypothetical protein